MKLTPSNIPSDTLLVRTLIGADYETTHDQMLQQTLDRIDKKKQGIITPDELWIVEHNDVYTLGQAGKKEHILQRTSTPIIHTDRGGQVTWHGKGQLVIYWLIDLNTLGWSVRDLVSHAEQSIEDVLNQTLQSSQQLQQFQQYAKQQHTEQQNTEQPSQPDSQPTNQSFYAKARQDAPGVYIYNQDDLMLGKIASLGFKIKQGFSYHGIALNLTCDLNAFNSINPCGYAGMQMLRLADFVDLDKVDTLSDMEANSLKINSLQVTDESITALKVTHDLLHNIQQRDAGKIQLRRTADRKR